MRWREWLGVGERRWKKAPDEEVQPGKTLWDWLQLLIVPAILIGVTFAWSGLQTSSDNAREDRRIAADLAAAEQVRQDATLNDYFKQMSDLMLNKKLLSSNDADAVRSVARTVTLTALRRLNESRRGEVVRFLGEARLLYGVPGRQPLVNLTGIDLAGGDFSDLDLAGGDFENANLARANFEEADLTGATLAVANLTGADLFGADLENANLFGANLKDARLSDAHLLSARLDTANLVQADLARADLSNAGLNSARLEGADLTGADLTGADLENANLARANFEETNLVRTNLAFANLAGAKNLNLERFITDLAPKRQKPFLDSQKRFLDSLSAAELAKFNLTPEELAKLRREASGN